LLNSIKQPWQIIYNIPDLTGIQQAIMEGLGVTVLARSTVPEELKILPTSARYPDLGSVGITLITGSQGAKKQAAQRLVEYLKTGLT
jgi:DNA-binding transcriptional LysR family regulator